MTKKKNSLVFLDVCIDGDPVERMVFELFSDVVPKTAENFRVLCTGEKGIGPTLGKPLHYKGTLFHRIMKGSMAQGGDLLRQEGAVGESIYGDRFPDESPNLKHDEPGLLSMPIADRDASGSIFYLLFKANPDLDRKHVVFGKLVYGLDVLKKIENAGDEDGRPAFTVKIVNCGEFSESDKKKHSKKLGKEGSLAVVGQEARGKGKHKKASRDRRKKRTRHYSSSESSSGSELDSTDSDSDSDSEGEESSSDNSSSSDDRRKERKRSRRDRLGRGKCKDRGREKKRRRRLDKRSRRRASDSLSDTDSDSETESSSEDDINAKDVNQKSDLQKAVLPSLDHVATVNNHIRFEDSEKLDDKEYNYPGENVQQRVNGYEKDGRSGRGEDGQPDVVEVPESRDKYTYKKINLEFSGVKQVAGSNKYFDFVSFYVDFSDGRDCLFRPSDGTQVSVHSLRDKYLLLCFVSFPLPSSVRDELAVIFKLYPQLVSRAGGAFEIVFVAVTHNQADFDSIFTPEFPGLTIPFLDSHEFGAFIRDFIFLSIGLTPIEPELDPLVGMILHPACIVLQENYCGKCFVDYGAEFFPFTYERVNELLDTEYAIRGRCRFPERGSYIVEKLTLADLLCCEPSRVLYRFGSGCDDKITVDELSRKNCVGVYICGDGKFMTELASVYIEFHKVREDGSKDERDFEIVMVRLCDVYDDKALARIEPEVKTASSWWEFPYHDHTSLRLKRVCRNNCEDSLMIVRPNGNFWERSGKAVLRSDGIASYPFTKESYLDRMTSVTVDSLLGDGSQTLVKIRNILKKENHNQNKKYSVGSRLRGKNVFVYFDIPGSMNTGAWKCLRDAYNTDRCEFEVVFVPLETTSYDDPELELCIRKMPKSWFMLLPQFVNMLGLYTATEGCKGHTVAFGNDGRIRTKCPEFYMGERSGIATLFAHDLNELESERMLEGIVQHFQKIIDTLE